jgi:hypothetical protein
VRSLGLGNATPPFFLRSPSQISFIPDASHVLVTDKERGVVDAFGLRPDGRPADVVQEASGLVAGRGEDGFGDKQRHGRAS